MFCQNEERGRILSFFKFEGLYFRPTFYEFLIDIYWSFFIQDTLTPLHYVFQGKKNVQLIFLTLFDPR